METLKDDILPIRYTLIWTDKYGKFHMFKGLHEKRKEQAEKRLHHLLYNYHVLSTRLFQKEEYIVLEDQNYNSKGVST